MNPHNPFLVKHTPANPSEKGRASINLGSITTLPFVSINPHRPDSSD